MCIMNGVWEKGRTLACADAHNSITSWRGDMWSNTQLFERLFNLELGQVAGYGDVPQTQTLKLRMQSHRDFLTLSQ